MNKQDREEYHRRFGRARKEGLDARKMLTPFRWVRHKLTGDPLRKRERRYIERTLYPNQATTYRFDLLFPDRINLVSIEEKYLGENHESDTN